MPRFVSTCISFTCRKEGSLPCTFYWLLNCAKGLLILSGDVIPQIDVLWHLISTTMCLWHLQVWKRAHFPHLLEVWYRLHIAAYQTTGRIHIQVLGQRWTRLAAENGTVESCTVISSMASLLAVTNKSPPSSASTFPPGRPHVL